MNVGEPERKENTLNNILLWVFGVFLLISFLISFYLQFYINGLLFFLATIITIPPLAEELEKKLNVHISGVVRFYVVFIVVASAFYATHPPIPVTSTEINSSTVDSKLDPNWFYSSSAQCAAAIVGLMGAFIVTKLMNQKAFVAQLKKEIKDCRIMIDTINQEIEPKIRYIQESDNETNTRKANELADDFLNEIIIIIDPDNPCSIDIIYNIAAQVNEKYSNIDKDILKEKYNEDYFSKAREYLEDLVDTYLNYLKKSKEIDIYHLPPVDVLFNETKEKTKGTNYQPVINNKSIFEDKYKKFVKSLSRSPLESLMDYDYNDAFKMVSFPSKNLASIENISILNKYEQYKEEVVKKTAELSRYKILLDDKLSSLAKNEDVPSMKDNMIMLFLFSITDVFFPLFMMLCDNETMVRYRLFTFAIISIGWIAVVGNLSGEIWKLLNHSPEP